MNALNIRYTTTNALKHLTDQDLSQNGVGLDRKNWQTNIYRLCRTRHLGDWWSKFWSPSRKNGRKCDWASANFTPWTPVTYFCPALDPPLDGSGRKTTTLVRDLKYFIHTKFHQNPSSGSGEEVENVNSLTDDRRRTDAGQRVITIVHWSLWLLCPKNSRPLIYLVQWF